MRLYYSAKLHWRKLKPVFELPEIRAIAHLQMERYQEVREREFGRAWPKRKRLLPADYDSCDWRLDHRGRRPAFWDWVCYGACHWMAPIYLLVIRRARPGENWSLLSSPNHATVYYRDLIFDPQYEALGLTPDEAWKMASTKRKLKR